MTGSAPCGTCGTPGPVASRYCLNCGRPRRSASGAGAPTVGASTAVLEERGEPAASPTGPGSRGGRRRTASVAAAALLVLAVLAGAGVLLSRDDQPAAGDPVDVRSSTPPAESAEASARCWDGTTAASIGECTSPTGIDGVRWLFPGFDLEGAGCALESERGKGARDMFGCRQGDDDDLYYNFSEFDSPRRAFTYYSQDAGYPAYDERPGLLRWDYRTRDFKTALLYVHRRWGVTIYADEPAKRDQAVRELLGLMRPADELRGVPG